MAYVVAKSISFEGGGSSFSAPIPSPHAEDDILIAVVTQNTTSTLMAASGWTSFGDTDASTGHRTQGFWKKATSDDEPNLVVTGADTNWQAHILVLRGADLTTPIDAVSKTAAQSSQLESGTFNTVTNNCLILYVWASQTDYKFKPANTATTPLLMKSDISPIQVSSYDFVETAGAVPVKNMWSERGFAGNSCLAFAVKPANSSVTLRPPLIEKAYDVIRSYNGRTNASNSSNEFARHDPATTIQSFSEMAATTIGGIGIVAQSPNLSIHTLVESQWGTSLQFRTNTSGIDSNGRWCGISHAMESWDLTGKVLHIRFGQAAVSAAHNGPEGMICVLEDSSGDWAAFQLSSRTLMVPNESYSYFFTPETPYYDSGGTIDWSDITRVGWAIHRLNSTTNRDTRIKDFVAVNETVLYGGSSVTPITPSFVQNALEGWGVVELASLQGTGQIITRGGVVFGNGTDKTTTAFTKNSLEFPVRPPTSFLGAKWNVPDNYLNIGINTSTDDNVGIGRSLITSNTRQVFKIEGSTPDQMITGGSVLSGLDISIDSSTTFIRVVFNECYKIDLGDSELNNCSVEESLEDIAVETASPDNISNTSFVSPGTGHAIEATATGTFAFTGNTFTGYGADNTTDAAFYNNSGGLITLAIPPGDQLPTVRNGSGASTVLDTPVDSQTVTINGGISGTRIQLYDITADEELVNEVVSSFPFEWTDPDPYVADREIRLRAALVDEDEAKVFVDQVIGTATNAVPAIAFLLNQQDDLIYNLNAIDGELVEDVTIDESVLIAQIDTGQLSWQELYAYQVYWLFTEEGIQDEGQKITAVDQANYLFDDLIISNVTDPEVPLIMTGGYARNLTTGQTIDVFDTDGGRTFNAPDHVVAFATGSGVTAGDKTDIISGVWNKALSAHTTPGSAGKTLADAEANSDVTQAKVDQL